MSENKKNEHKMPMPSYFEVQDGQTPSNTPSNKIKGTGLSYDITNVDFSAKLMENHKYSEVDEDDLNSNKEKEKDYCSAIYIGKGETGINLNLGEVCCSNLFCDICFAKVNRIVSYKWDETTQKQNPNLKSANEKILIDEHLVKDEAYCFYYCKCKMQNTNSKFTNIKEFGLPWECDGHKKQN